MPTDTTVRPAILGKRLEEGSDAFGEMRQTAPDSPMEHVRARLEEDGYVYMPGFFERDRILEVRRILIDRLAEADLLDLSFPRDEAVAKEGIEQWGFDLDLVGGNKPLHDLLYTGNLVHFYERLLGGAIRHLDYTWSRVVPGGHGTAAHCDIVFMGRGTRRLYTSWVPYGDVPYDLGGLAVLEGSHRSEELQNGYCQHDVDTYCENLGEAASEGPRGGALSEDAVELRKKLGGRWLSAEFRAGDLVVITMYLVHGGLDNQTPRFRLSTDTRYQLASEPADERWIGSNPSAHSLESKHPMIC